MDYSNFSSTSRDPIRRIFDQLEDQRMEDVLGSENRNQLTEAQEEAREIGIVLGTEDNGTQVITLF